MSDLRPLGNASGRQNTNVFLFIGDWTIRSDSVWSKKQDLGARAGTYSVTDLAGLQTILR